MAGKRRAIALVCVIALCLGMLSACRKEPVQESTDPSTQPAPMTYTVELVAQGGKPMEGIGVYIYEDASLKELVWFEKTDELGQMTFTDAESDAYVAVLDKVPEGYPVEENYPITGLHTRIELGTAQMAEVSDLAGVNLKLGDVMADYTFTAADGTEYTISQLLQEKKAVVLNFWYVECAPCKMEFPFLQQAYEAYEKDVALLALNPVNQDPQAVADFQKTMELTMPMAVCEPEWQQALNLTAYPTTVVIDRYGTISMIHSGSITEADPFKDIFAFFSAEDYKPTVITSLDQIPEAKDDDETLSGGTKENPLEFGGVSYIQITVKPEQLIYCNVYKVDGMWMSINDSDAYVLYNDRTYTASGGSVGLVVNTPDMRTPVALAFGNSGTETKTYTVYFSALKGTLNNPYSMELGEFSISVGAGNDQGVYCAYKVKEDGVLTVECLEATSGVEYDYTLYNLDSYALRNYRSDMSVTVDGKRVVTIKASAGDTIRFSAAAMPDSSGNYPAAKFKFLATYGDGAEEELDPAEIPILYAVTVTDEARKPIPGAQVFMTLEKEQLTLTTNAEGIAYTKQKPGDYPITLKVPAGYKARTTKFTLTKDFPTVSIKLDPDVYVEGDYAVTVVDEAAQPMQNVLVAVGDRFGYTDYTGMVSFSLEKGTYSADVLPPEGYTADNISTDFGEEMSLTVTLKKGSAPAVDSAVSHSITVVDNSGKAVPGILVRFTGANGVAAMGVSDDKGIVSAELIPGNYRITLAFSGDGFYYDPNSAALTPTLTSTHVRITANKVDKTNVVSTYMGQMLVLTEGSTYADGMQPDVPNYFVFVPENSGLYQFSTSSFTAVISYWGGNTSFIQDMTASTDYSPVTNFFTRNVKEGNLGSTYVIGVTGAEECIIDIVRIGDAVLDETDIVPTVYKGETPVKQATPSGKLTYVDLTADTDAVKAVKGSDGYYHLNAADGPRLYVNLGTNAPYVSMYNMLGFLGYGGTSLSRTFYDGEGKATHREDYTECMMTYVECIDSKHGVYPLNDDLIYMIQNGGEFKGWWDAGNGNYVFGEVSGFNPELGWMFACCYFE